MADCYAKIIQEVDLLRKLELQGKLSPKRRCEKFRDIILELFSILTASQAKEHDKPVQQMFIDFAKHNCMVGEKQTQISQTQPWLLMQYGIRSKSVHWLDGFLLFGWPNTIKNPKRCFAVIIAKSNKLIEGIEFQHLGRKADVWELTGKEGIQNKFNITEAENLLREALSEMEKPCDNWNIPVEKIVKAFKIDPHSLNLALCVAEIVTNEPNVVFPSEMLKSIYKLLQGREKRYREGIYTIENYLALADDDLEEQVQKYRCTLDRISKSLQQLSLHIKDDNVQEASDKHINDIIQHIQKIRTKCKTSKEVFECHDFQELWNLVEFQNVCAAVTRRLIKYAKKEDYLPNYFAEAFKQHFAQLILDKVESTKLTTPYSLACYCRKVILPELRDEVFKDRFGLPYKMFVAILQKQRVKQRLSQSLGREATDAEIAKEMKISIEQLFEIKAAELSLGPYSFDEERDSDTDDNDEAPEP